MLSIDKYRSNENESEIATIYRPSIKDKKALYLFFV